MPQTLRYPIKEYEGTILSFPYSTSTQRNKNVAHNGSVEPIKAKGDIARLKDYFKSQSPRDYLFFVLGINTGRRAGDLLSFKISTVFNPDMTVKDKVRIKEEKTLKYAEITLNDSVKQALTYYIDSLDGQYNMNDWLFPSRKNGDHITVRHAARMMRNAQADLKLPYSLGTHSLRKTWAYQVYMANQQDPYVLYTIQRMLNHSSTSVTLRYMGITQETEAQVYRNVVL